MRNAQGGTGGKEIERDPAKMEIAESDRNHMRIGITPPQGHKRTPGPKSGGISFQMQRNC